MIEFTLKEKLDHIAEHFMATGDQHDAKAINEAMQALDKNYFHEFKAATIRGDVAESNCRRLVRELADEKYRFECLKSIYTDQMNYESDSTVDSDIDGFIQEEQSHS